LVNRSEDARPTPPLVAATWPRRCVGGKTGVRTIEALLGLGLTGLGALLALAFYERYWLWRDCFNELGRCYDPVSQDVYLEQAGIVWGSLAAICLLGGLALLLRHRHR
jgi:hypothetical protein